MATRQAGGGQRAWVMILSLFFTCSASLARAQDDKPLWTPPPGPEPHVNGARVYGCRPDKPFLYRIPCTGQRPLQFEVETLPDGLSLDPSTGIITGRTPAQPGNYKLVLNARNSLGEDSRELTLVVGETLALTPPMGFNDWYTWYDRITQDDMMAGADAIISSGMADYGYNYVNIDDCWMVKAGSDDLLLGAEKRDETTGAIRPNGRFLDMKGLADYIHSRGLKAGLYSSPGPETCTGFEGSYGHEADDAKQFAAWGFDFLKYDWCSYGRIVKDSTDPDRFRKPFRLMGDLLQQQDRDILLNLCQYGMDEVWTWGRQVGGHSWRTTGDLGLEKDARLPGFYSIGLKNAQLHEHAGPGGWNDPDYLLIGLVGNARDLGQPPLPTTLTADEQYSYMSMWCLMASPLFYSGQVTRLDPFTLNVLCNPELIDINQDELGKQARIIRQNDEELVLAKPMADGSLALGLFNLAEKPREVSVTWQELGLATGASAVRDSWRHRDLEVGMEGHRATLPRHSVEVTRIKPTSH